MNPRDPLEEWTSARASASPPEDFADRVMVAVRRRALAQGRDRGAAGDVRPRRVPRPFAVAASICAALACHTALASAVWLAWPAIAR
jgi:hypothetical protein